MDYKNTTERQLSGTISNYVHLINEENLIMRAGIYRWRYFYVTHFIRESVVYEYVSSWTWDMKHMTSLA